MKGVSVKRQGFIAGFAGAHGRVRSGAGEGPATSLSHNSDRS